MAYRSEVALLYPKDSGSLDRNLKHSRRASLNETVRLYFEGRKHLNSLVSSRKKMILMTCNGKDLL